MTLLNKFILVKKLINALKALSFSFFLILVITTFTSFTFNTKSNEDKILSYIANPKTADIQFYWKNDLSQTIGSIQNLKKWLDSKNKKLVFAMNGGMYTKDQAPQGLFIQNQIKIIPIDTTSGKGNFYLKPNGVFYITTDNEPKIVITSDFVNTDKIKNATQSGPMLIINGEIHSAFKEGSQNLNIRNGVGILPDNKIIFAISKEAINFYDFAIYFKNLGCKNALYLDGFVSRAYCPEKNWKQTDGNFGVIIGITK